MFKERGNEKRVGKCRASGRNRGGGGDWRRRDGNDGGEGVSMLRISARSPARGIMKFPMALGWPRRMQTPRYHHNLQSRRPATPKAALGPVSSSLQVDNLTLKPCVAPKKTKHFFCMKYLRVSLASNTAHRSPLIFHSASDPPWPVSWFHIGQSVLLFDMDWLIYLSSRAITHPSAFCR